MKYLILLLALTACVEEKRSPSGLREMTVQDYEIVCYEGIKYLFVGHSPTPKINRVTRNPESCDE